MKLHLYWELFVIGMWGPRLRSYWPHENPEILGCTPPPPPPTTPSPTPTPDPPTPPPTPPTHPSSPTPHPAHPPLQPPPPTPLPWWAIKNERGQRPRLLISSPPCKGPAMISSYVTSNFCTLVSMSPLSLSLGFIIIIIIIKVLHGHGDGLGRWN